MTQNEYKEKLNGLSKKKNLFLAIMDKEYWIDLGVILLLAIYGFSVYQFLAFCDESFRDSFILFKVIQICFIGVLGILVFFFLIAALLFAIGILLYIIKFFIVDIPVRIQSRYLPTTKEELKVMDMTPTEFITFLGMSCSRTIFGFVFYDNFLSKDIKTMLLNYMEINGFPVEKREDCDKFILEYCKDDIYNDILNEMNIYIM